MVRDEEGVDIFLGNIEGDLEELRIIDISGWVGGVFGIGGTPCKIDIRFALRASVGLTVRAPSPVACDEVGIPGITDIRFPDDDGVFVPLPLFRPGDLPVKDDDLLWSGVPAATDKCA